MTIEVPAAVTALVEETGGTVAHRGDVLRLGFGDTALQVRDAGGRFVVEAIERGVVEGVNLRTTSRAALDRYLVVVAGGSWRTRQRLPTLRAPAGGAAAATPVPEGSAWTLEWQDASGSQRAVLWSRFDAQQLARALPQPLDVVVDAVRDPVGDPLFEVI